MGESSTLRKLFVKDQGEPEIGGFDNMTVSQIESTYQHKNYYDRIVVKSTFLTITDPHYFMHLLHEIAKEKCSLVIATPYGSSDNAYENLQFKRRVFKETYRIFWPHWEYTRRVFYLDANFPGFQGAEDHQMALMVANLRNVVKEFVAELTCIKGAIDLSKGMTEPSTGFKMI